MAGVPKGKAQPSRLVGQSAHLSPGAGRPQGYSPEGKADCSPLEGQGLVGEEAETRQLPSAEAPRKPAAPGMVAVGCYMHWARLAVVLCAQVALHLASGRGLRLAGEMVGLAEAFLAVVLVVRLVGEQKMLPG